MAKVKINQAALRRVVQKATDTAQVRLNEAVQATAAHAQGKSREEVESMLRAEMSARGIEPTDTTALADRIVEGAMPSV